MNYTIEQIQLNLAPLAHPTLAGTLAETAAITAIEVIEDKLTISFAIPRTREQAFADFQRAVLSKLKIEMQIDKVRLVFLEQQEMSTPNPLAPTSRYIGVVSGKGGVGKSTTTVGLARALTARGEKVAIIDADIYGSSIPKIMQLAQRKPEVVGKQVKPFIQEGIELISSSLLISDSNPVMWKGPMISKLLRQFFSDIAWNKETTVFLIDMPPGTGDIMLELQQIIPQCEMLIVTTPQEDAAFVATKAGLAALELEHPILGVIENMSYVPCHTCNSRNYVFGTGGGAYVAEALGCDVLAQIPLDAAIPTDCFDLLAEQLYQQQSPQEN